MILLSVSHLLSIYTHARSYEGFNIEAGVIEEPTCAESNSNYVLYFKSESTAFIPMRSLVIGQFSLNCTDGQCSNTVGLLRGI